MKFSEKLLIEIMKANRKDIAIIYLEDYIQIYGFLSDEAAREVRKIIKENKLGNRKYC